MFFSSAFIYSSRLSQVNLLRLRMCGTGVPVSHAASSYLSLTAVFI
jgi:hypothetical protein